MDFLAYCGALARIQSCRWTPRQKRLNALTRVLHAEQYAHIRIPFSQEHEGNNPHGKRVLLDDRRPAVQDELALQVVREQAGLIFGEDHRPLVLCKDDENTTEWIAAFVADTEFWLVLMEALWKGSVGSCAVVLRVLGKQKDVEVVNADQTKTIAKAPDGPGRYYFEVWAGEECRPVFNPARPDELISIDRRYFIGEDSLAAQGYDVAELKRKWDKKSAYWQRSAKRALNAGSTTEEWLMRLVIDETKEERNLPVPRYIYERTDWKDTSFEIDADYSKNHDLGEMPVEWIRPLPVDADRYYPDGACLFEPVIDPEFRINRTLSQVGRAFDYAGDPQMAQGLAGGAGPGGDVLPSGAFGQAASVGGTSSDMIDGDAKFVEISGDGLKIAIETYVSAIEEVAKRNAAMSRVTPDTQTGNQPLSSVAMKMLNFAQLVLSGILRVTIGERPGKRILKLAMRIFEEIDVELPSLVNDVAPKPKAAQEWQWPDYYEPHGIEKLSEVQAATAAQVGGAISKKTMVANLGPLFDVQSPDDEMTDIEKDQDDAAAQEVVQADAMGAVEAKHNPKPSGPPK